MSAIIYNPIRQSPPDSMNIHRIKVSHFIANLGSREESVESGLSLSAAFLVCHDWSTKTLPFRHLSILYTPQ
jgi:hypothetical protein